MRRSLRALSTVMIIAGCLLIADAAATVLWQEPVSAVYGSYQQKKLRKEFRRLAAVPLTPGEKRTLGRLGSDGRRRMAVLARAYRRQLKDGQAMARIELPRLDGSWVVVQGTQGADLRKGPGHFDDTALPGLHGTVAIAGHRTTYKAPFRRIDQLKRGDALVLDMPYGRFSYKVEKTRIVPPDALWVTRAVGYDRLVLSACHPLYSAQKRIIVFARLASAQPRGAARA